MDFKKLTVVGCQLAFVFGLFVPNVRAQVDPGLRNRLERGALVVDHRSMQLFDQIPDQYIQRARNITMTFMDRSVGDNINTYLSCLEHDWAHQTTAHCKSGVTAQEYDVDFDNYYLRTNWEFFWSDASLWNPVISDFFTQVVPGRSNRDVITFQFNYLGLFADSHINDAYTGQAVRDYTPGFFYGPGVAAGRYDISDVEQFQQNNPSKVFFHWTGSIAKSIGTQNATTFNSAMRNYVNQNRQILLDYADIMSHTDTGARCTYNGLEALCDEYTNEVNGGHLNALGGLRISKAVWVLMAQMAGWEPGVVQTPAPSVTSGPTATPRPRAGDANRDGRVDGIDYVIWVGNYNRTTSQREAEGDFNGDERVDGQDYVVWLSNYGV